MSECGGAARRRAWVLALCVVSAGAWQQWTWKGRGPGPRYGHSFFQYRDTIYVFAGRDNDNVSRHVPSTYEIADVHGQLVFSNYETKRVHPCIAGVCDDTVPVAVVYNDIWAYDMNCERWSDTGCQRQGWRVVDKGARLAGCYVDEAGLEWCSHPSERYDHTSAVFPDGTLFLYGGFSDKCEDYCSDMWTFDIAACEANVSCVWAPRGTLGRHGPGKRWRAATTTEGYTMYLYGGMRMWQGFAQANTVMNLWSDYAEYPPGGFLADLWTLDFTTLNWTQPIRLQSCYADPGATWESRSQVSCTVHWPLERASATLVVSGGLLYLYGGFRTFFPYPNSNAKGAGPGTASLAADGYVPYPSYPFYFNDMWQYNLSSGRWRQLLQADSAFQPVARRDHAMVIVGDVFFLHGGYASNFWYDDFWMYNVSTNAWLAKSEFVYAQWPASCTDDTRSGNESVWGQPTRGTVLDGAGGRVNYDVFIQQQRRQAPGWDGCRDRADRRRDLPRQLTYLRPSQRGGHRVLWAERFRLMMLYGGRGLTTEESPRLDTTYPVAVQGDLWQLGIDQCPKNCSLQGSCYYGFCFCYDGFYGLDCSNISCPGDFSYYDPQSHAHVVKHCCHAAYMHVDNETYQVDEKKVACSLDQPGESHGICNGFGQCQCAPPFLTLDCSVRDCPRNCSGTGWCSVEYPIARCMCDPGYIGTDCSTLTCPNNCSFPNGYCNAGTCVCGMTPNPYNRTQIWKPYQGIDCSFVVPYAAAERSLPAFAIIVLLCSMAVLVASHYA